jgi:hypothetical protein
MELIACSVRLARNARTGLEKSKVDWRTSTLAAIEKALTKAGIEFPAGGRKRGGGREAAEPEGVIRG